MQSMNKDKDNDLLKDLKKAMTGSEMEEQFLKRREIFLWGEINDESAQNIVKKILYYDGLSNDDITIYINSPGGVISAGLAIYDAMLYAKSDVSTVCMGQAASMGAVLLCSGTKGKRFAWEHARVLIHQPLISGNMFGPASDIQIQAEEMLRIRDNLNHILSSHTGQSLSKIVEDTDRDFFMSAEEAKKYGIVDKISK
ncbi:ATP-dependent Clp protease proteolytic subunit [Chitinispirillales bacterium ANBcel5]|uniref:ClpP family protease n=1 Tax=Cellulosispirillum alkaliphilum TaxID=3039283 RepID=UPI002A577D84|nr:ATP-dependent Clp protease proteolytic subunit [Chitinispirillales bacterium ANBcel5]